MTPAAGRHEDGAEALRAITRPLLLSPGEAMRQDEAAAGRQIIFPGEVWWLPKSDWIDDVVVSRDGNDIRIIAIVAKKIGSGAFSRLTAGICRAGLTPIVVEAMGIMPTILRHWGWRRTRVGSGFTTEEQWRPRGKAWAKARSALASSAEQRGEG